MLSPQRLAANRRNAKKSTGPRTEAGKATSSANGLKSGLDSKRLFLPSESADEFASVTAVWRREYSASTPEEACLVDVLIDCFWLLGRLARIGAELDAQERAFARDVTSIGRARRTRELRAAATRNDQFMRLKRRRQIAADLFQNAENELIHLCTKRLLPPAASPQP